MKYNIEYIRMKFIEKDNMINKTEDDIEKLENLRILLNSDDIFFSLDSDTALGILSYLGIEDENLKKAYFDLISLEEFKKNNSNYYFNTR